MTYNGPTRGRSVVSTILVAVSGKDRCNGPVTTAENEPTQDSAAITAALDLMAPRLRRVCEQRPELSWR
jgi:hypothetical protein